MSYVIVSIIWTCWLWHHREYVVDLVEKPGFLCDPNSLLNGPSSISISSPLHFPRFKQVQPTMDFRSLAKQYFSDFQSLNLVFNDSSAGKNFSGQILFNLGIKFHQVSPPLASCLFFNPTMLSFDVFLQFLSMLLYTDIFDKAITLW